MPQSQCRSIDQRHSRRPPFEGSPSGTIPEGCEHPCSDRTRRQKETRPWLGLTSGLFAMFLTWFSFTFPLATSLWRRADPRASKARTKAKTLRYAVSCRSTTGRFRCRSQAPSRRFCMPIVGRRWAVTRYGQL